MRTPTRDYDRAVLWTIVIIGAAILIAAGIVRLA
jgi:hypothetical protein